MWILDARTPLAADAPLGTWPHASRPRCDFRKLGRAQLSAPREVQLEVEAGPPPWPRYDLKLGAQRRGQFSAHREPEPGRGEGTPLPTENRSEGLVETVDDLRVDPVAAVRHGKLNAARPDLLRHHLDVPLVGALQGIRGQV